MARPQLQRALVDRDAFNRDAELPYGLRPVDFEVAMTDAYDLLYDINSALIERDLARLDDMVPGATLSGMLSEIMTDSMAAHSRVLTRNGYHNGHPDLIPKGRYKDDAVQSGKDGVEVKSTRGSLGVDMHGAREQWLCIFRYAIDNRTEPAVDRTPTQFIEIALAKLELDDFRWNQRGQLGTNTASPNREGLKKLRANRVYRLE